KNHNNQKLNYFPTRRSSDLKGEIETLERKLRDTKEESKDNVQHTDTESLAEQAAEIINGYGILKGEEAVLKLRWYNYAESFQMRDRKSTRLNSSHRTISYAV